MTFTHGVASFDPTSSGVLLWVRAEGVATVRWKVAVDHAAAVPLHEGDATVDPDTGIAVADVGGLEPSTTYHYWFEAPSPDQPNAAKIAPGAPSGDSSRTGGAFFPIVSVWRFSTRSSTRAPFRLMEPATDGVSIRTRGVSRSTTSRARSARGASAVGSAPGWGTGTCLPSMVRVAGTIDTDVQKALDQDDQRAKVDYLLLNGKDLIYRLNDQYGGAIGLSSGFSFADGD